MAGSAMAGSPMCKPTNWSSSTPQAPWLIGRQNAADIGIGLVAEICIGLALAEFLQPTVLVHPVVHCAVDALAPQLLPQDLHLVLCLRLVAKPNGRGNKLGWLADDNRLWGQANELHYSEVADGVDGKPARDSSAQTHGEKVAAGNKRSIVSMRRSRLGSKDQVCCRMWGHLGTMDRQVGQKGRQEGRTQLGTQGHDDRHA
mmetsp:Transcript_92897/g.179155  ORF Transcript_92897/g.179155 Transcript_92897/m.179155 type:complete len:201 (+) Transcript_92897:194-796(+)